MAAALFSVLGYGALTTGAHGPGFGTVEAPVAAAASATINRTGADVIITGSVDSLFQSGGFIGPNRTAKQDRSRITVDALSFTKGFEAGRTRLAALRNPPATEQTRMASSVARDAAPTIQTASLDPDTGTAALMAISAVAPDQSMPLPLMASQQLAYARANEPVTDVTKPVAPQYSEKELWCLATAIYFEARGEAYRGQVAVAQVVMNRTHHKLYPSTICGVVFQNQSKRNACQFSFACDGQPETITDQKSWTQAQEIAGKVASGELYLAEVAEATHYHASNVYPDWAPRMKKLTKIGLHVFYRFKHGWNFG